jgi:hypothetical protein
VISSNRSAARWSRGRSRRAQQLAIPVIGFLNGGSPDAFAPMVAAFHEGLKEPVAAGLHEIGYAGRL